MGIRIEIKTLPLDRSWLNKLQEKENTVLIFRKENQLTTKLSTRHQKPCVCVGDDKGNKAYESMLIQKEEK